MLAKEWARGPQFKSEQAKREWLPKIRKAQAAWNDLEVSSVTFGVRDSALVFLTTDEVPVASRDCAYQNLEVTILTRQDNEFRAAIHRPGLARAWHNAWDAGDETIGVLLGYPSCCREFFAREWKRDTTLAMRTVDGPWQSNILLRWIGIRLVGHLPCSGTCAETYRLARTFESAARSMGLAIEEIEELLQLPVTFDARNGLAIVDAGPFRFQTSTDMINGTVSRAYPWTDNGFGSELAMNLAHSVIVRAVGSVESALDLGCGDGRLLSRIARTGRPGIWQGIESDSGRATRKRYPIVRVQHSAIEDLAWIEGKHEATLLMPGRLIEMTDSERIEVLGHLRGRRLVLYAYGDWLADGLPDLARRAGLELVGMATTGAGVAAGDGRVR